MTLIFDIEADGLLDTVTKVHCLVFRSPFQEARVFVGEEIKEGLKILKSARQVVGHNILCYDLPVLKKLYGFEHDNAFDTLVASRLIWTNLLEEDSKYKKIPKALYGKHSLEAHGHRLGEYKTQVLFDWKVFHHDMIPYCEQDVNVTCRLYDTIKNQNYSERALEIEHRFRSIIFQQERNGVPFDVTKARELAVRLDGRVKELKDRLRSVLPLQLKRGGTLLPKRDNTRLGYRAGAPLTKISFHEPNPGSRVQVIEFLQSKYGWQPEIYTDNGNPKLDDEILRGLPYEGLDGLADLFEGIKIQGYLTKGKNAWLKLVKNGRIHGSVNTNGAVTGRCTHSNPNLSQVPSTRSSYGEECRSLFHSGGGFMVGADASGIELRCLAHYLAFYDGGKYAKIILEEDIHTANQLAAELESRDDAKTFIYAYLYGAGNGKLGSIVTKSKDVEKNQRIGSQLRENFLRKIDGLRNLTDAVRDAANKKGYLVGLDGRHLHVRSEHRALNTLLQGAAAVLMKQANINFWEQRIADTYQVLNVHDEWQVITNSESLTKDIGEHMVGSITKAGEDFKLRIRLDGEYKVGKNWANTH